MEAQTQHNPAPNTSGRRTQNIYSSRESFRLLFSPVIGERRCQSWWDYREPKPDASARTEGQVRNQGWRSQQESQTGVARGAKVKSHIKAGKGPALENAVHVFDFALRGILAL